MFNPFKRKPQIIDDPPADAAPAADPDGDISIFKVGQRITINGLPFRVARFGERELHLRLEGRGKLTWQKRPARRARTKARRK